MKLTETEVCFKRSQLGHAHIVLMPVPMHQFFQTMQMPGLASS
jgi:hypothetical protein